TTSVNDSNTANDHDTDTDTVSKSSDLSITKDDGVGSVVAGTSTTYAITLTNGGPSTEPAGVVITDPIPAGTTGSETEADCTLGANFVCTTTVALAPGASVIYHLTLAVAPSYSAGTLANTATISTSVNDSNTANDHDTDTDTVSKSSDLSITKDDGVGSVVAGTS